MTDIDKLKSAKYFVDSLANGRNPFSQEELPDEDVVNDVRAARWFFYLSGVLDEVIQNGGVTASTATVGGCTAKCDYYLTDEMRASFRFSQTPLLISEISKRIVEIGPKEKVKKFPRSNITKWLVSIGLIEEIPLKSGKMGKIPSALGEEIGITKELRIANEYYYYILLYNENAQHFIIDNIDAVLAFDSKAFDEERAARLAAMRNSSAEDDAPSAVCHDEPSAEVCATDRDSSAEVCVTDREPSAEVCVTDRDEPHGDSIAPAESAAIGAQSDTSASSPAPKAESTNGMSCLSCKFSRSGECFPHKNICPEFELAYTVPEDERAGWPDYGDASALRRREKR